MTATRTPEPAVSKTKTQTFSGVVERCELKQRKPFDPYCDKYGGDHWECYLDVALRLDDGSTVYFCTPAVGMNIGSGGSVAIVCYRVEGHAADWMRESLPEGGSRCATPGKSNDNTLEPLVNVGDRLTVSGRVKRETVSKAGKPYRVINWVRRAK
jgi:hypothetical protein